MRDEKPEEREKIGGMGESCSERRGVVISMTGGVEGAERGARKGSFFFSFFYHHVFVVKVQETTWSASYGVNKTINNLMTRFTP